ANDLEWSMRELGYRIMNNTSSDGHWKLGLEDKAGGIGIAILTRKGAPPPDPRMDVKPPRGFAGTAEEKGPLAARVQIKRGAGRDKAAEAKVAAALAASPGSAPKPQVAKLGARPPLELKELAAMPALKAFMLGLFGKECPTAGNTDGSQASTDCKKDNLTHRLSVECRSPAFDSMYDLAGEAPNSAVYVAKNCTMAAKVFAEAKYPELDPAASRELLVRAIDAAARRDPKGK
ncbi:MAG TPA: hypothetical protein VFS00_13390, partial [Polyangiaceae bacterium]|nr:hypothetical protein [Polyangiaceae bacterium]